MKSDISNVRRAQRVIKMVSELHRLGYQNLRIMPYKHPNAWRLAVGPKECFSSRNGARLKNNEWGNVPIYTAAGDGNDYFDWTDAKADGARTLAEKFIRRFPEVANRGLGRDWAYAGWLLELIGFLESGNYLPVTYWDNMEKSPDELRYLPIWTVSIDTVTWGYETVGFDTDSGHCEMEFPLPPAIGKDDSERTVC